MQIKKGHFVVYYRCYPLHVEEVIIPDTLECPYNEYGLSKLVCERLGKTISDIYSIDLTILRLGPIYSVDNPNANKISGLLQCLRNNETITVHNPLNILSLLHLESAADAIAAAVGSPAGSFLVAGLPIAIGKFRHMLSVSIIRQV